MNRQYESMTRVQVGSFLVRVWRTETELSSGPSGEVKTALMGLDIECGESDIARALDKLANIAAFEILDDEGNGALIYPDWK